MDVCVYIASIYSSYGACMCGMCVYIECGFVYIYMVCACWMWMCVYGVVGEGKEITVRFFRRLYV